MNSSDPPEPSTYRKSIIISYFCTLFFWGSVYIYMPILAAYSRMITGSLQATGLVIGAYGLPQFLLRIPLGIWSDRWRRRKPFIILGFLFYGLAALGLAFSHSTVTLFLSVLTAGIASSFWVPFTVLFSSYFLLGQIAHSMSVILFFTRLSQIISNYAGGSIAEAWGWGAPFYAGIILAFSGLLMALNIADRRPEKSSAVSFKQLLLVGRNPTLLLASLTYILAQFVNYSTTLGFAPIFAQQIGASKGQLGILLVSHMVPNSLATLFSGTYIRRLFSERSIISAGFLLLAGAVFCIPLAAHLRILYILQGLNGIAIGLISPLLMGLALQSVPREQQATAMGFYQSLYAVGMTLGPILSGICAQKLGFSSVFVLNGILALAGGAFFLIKSDSIPALPLHRNP